MANKCEIKNCHFETWGKETKCVLHCKKSDYSTNKSNGVLFDFYNALAKYIKEQLYSHNQGTHLLFLGAEDTFEERLKNASDMKINILLAINNIAFPCRDDRDDYDYLSILRNFTKIQFSNCEFTASELKLDNISCFYEQCIFHENWTIYNIPILENCNDVLYQECIFHKDIDAVSEHNKNKYEIKVPLFNDCTFKANICFEKIIFTQPIFKNSENHQGKIGVFKLVDCKLEKNNDRETDSKFTLNHYKIDNFILKNITFESKFEFKQNKVDEFYIYNSNFGKDLVVDMYETEFLKFNIEKSIFEGFVGFERCIFSTENYSQNDQIARFTYATFLSFVNFRNAKFYGGLDLENANLKESPNFLNIEVNEEHSNRETFRIIKNAFDSVGNNLEGNKFFAYEMRKYRVELNSTNNRKPEKIIFWLNENISNFGQDYVRPIILMCLFALSFYLLTLGYENNLLYSSNNQYVNKIFETASDFLNSLGKSILPLDKFLKEGMEFLSVIFYIIYVSLTWQTLVALKRHTKR